MLFHAWGEFNKVTATGLEKRFTTVFNETGSAQIPTMYEYGRTVTKSYSYVGMDEATAKACAAAKIAQYKYVQAYYQLNGSTPTYFTRWACGANVSLDHDENCMWSVKVEVSQDDSFMYPSPMSEAQVDAFLPTLDYDESDPAGAMLMIDKIELQSNAQTFQLWCRYSHDIDGFVHSSTSLKVWGSNDGVTWTRYAPDTQSSASDGNLKLVSGNNSGYADVPQMFMLTWGASTVLDGTQVRSNAVTRPGVVPPAHVDSITADAPVALGGFWWVHFTPDIQVGWNFNNVEIYYHTPGGAWTHCDEQIPRNDCNFNTGVAVSDPQPQLTFKVTHGAVASNEVTTPYDPASETGDGILAVSGFIADVNGVHFTIAHNQSWTDLTGAVVKTWNTATSAWDSHSCTSAGPNELSTADALDLTTGYLRVVLGEHGTASLPLPLADADVATGIMVDALGEDDNTSDVVLRVRTSLTGFAADAVQWKDEGGATYTSDDASATAFAQGVYTIRTGGWSGVVCYRAKLGNVYSAWVPFPIQALP